MGIISIRVDIDGPLKAFKNLREKSLPFAIARALTKTAQDAQAETRKLEGRVFKLRNDWLVRNTRIKPAQFSTGWMSQRLVASVIEDSQNRTGSSPDYLSDQQDGGARIGYVTWEGGTYRAIASKYANPFGRVIPRELQPQNLLNAVDGFYPVRNRRGSMVNRRQKLVNGMEFFVAKLTDGTLALCGRRPGAREALPFYILVTSVAVSPRFPMEETVTSVASDRFAENLRTSVIETISNDLLYGSGVRVRL